MGDYYDDSFVEEGLDELFYKWHEVEGVNTIKELSRQLRMFLNYKAEVVKYRYQSSLTPPVHRDVAAFNRNKQDLYSVASRFIHELKKVKDKAQSLEQGIQHHAMRLDSTSLIQLIEITRNIFVIIHSFSEKELHEHPDLLRFVVKLARETSVVKKCLDIPLSEFYAELELNYEGLEQELEELLPKKVSREIKMKTKELEERLTS